MSIHGSAAATSVQVLVPTTDRLTTPRKALPPQPQRSASSATAATQPATPQQPKLSSEAAPQIDQTPSPVLTLRIASGHSGDLGDSEGELESPVSLWISPGRSGGLGSPSLHSGTTSPLARQAEHGDTVECVRDVVDDMLDRVEGRLAAAASPAMADFQFDTLPAATAPHRAAVWPPAHTSSPVPCVTRCPASGLVLLWC